MLNSAIKVFCGLGLIASANFSYAEADNQAPVVVELFTSQGCHSCPPADKHLGELSQEAGIIAFSCHVTYWNYLGWKDGFSRDFCDQRQRAYQPFLQGYQGVYTPQMVVNGRFTQVGGRRKTIKQAIEWLRKEQAIESIHVEADSSEVTIKLPSLDSQEGFQLYLLGTSGVHEVPISRGENGGKTLAYHHPVEASFHLGQWHGDTKTVKHATRGKESIKEWIVIAQQYPLGAIVAAGKFTLE